MHRAPRLCILEAINSAVADLNGRLAAVPGLKALGDGSLSFRGVTVAEALRCGEGVLLDVRAHLLDAPQLTEFYRFCQLLPAAEHGEEGWVRIALRPEGAEEALEAVREAVASAKDRVGEEEKTRAEGG